MVNYLADVGKVNPKLTPTVGYGSSKPLISKFLTANRAPNRRAEIELVREDEKDNVK